jgi:hypothetical protein
MSRINRRTMLATVGSTLTVGLAGCGSGGGGGDGGNGDDTETEVADGETGNVRVAHFSPDAPNVDVYVDDERVLEGVPFKGSEYVSVGAGDYTAQIRPDTGANDGQVASDADVSLDGGTVYTAFASGYLSPDDEPTDEAFELTVVQDASY